MSNTPTNTFTFSGVPARPKLLVPETMLLSLIGCQATFASGSIHKDRAIEQAEKLSNGGLIKLVYFKQETLNDDDFRGAVETLATWVSTYFG
ncbi:MAG: hypothetical protein ACTHNN_17495 [Xanthobacteraceae bacterium]